MSTSSPFSWGQRAHDSPSSLKDVKTRSSNPQSAFTPIAVNLYSFIAFSYYFEADVKNGFVFQL